MNLLQVYILISIVVLLIIFIVKRERKEKLTSLAGLSFAFIIAGIIFGSNRLVGYSLMSIGVLLALIDIFKSKKR